MAYVLLTPLNPSELSIYVTAFATGDAGALYNLRLDASRGRLSSPKRVAAVDNAFFVTIDRRRRRLYCINVEGEFLAGRSHVIAYALDDATAALRIVNRQASLGAGACYLSVNAASDALLVANYASGAVGSFALAADGSLATPCSLIEDGGRDAQTHCILFSPDGRFAFSAALSRSEIRAYEIDSSTQGLRRLDAATTRLSSGCDPRHLCFHPGGRHMYALSQASSSVSVLVYDSSRGRMQSLQTISTLPRGFTGHSLAADLQVTPDGRYLYACNRGHDSISVFHIRADGSLSRPTVSTCAGRSPHGLAISPCGSHLVCANLDSHEVVVFRIDSESGALTPAGEPAQIHRPTCIAFA